MTDPKADPMDAWDRQPQDAPIPLVDLDFGEPEIPEKKYLAYVAGWAFVVGFLILCALLAYGMR